LSGFQAKNKIKGQQLRALALNWGDPAALAGRFDGRLSAIGGQWAGCNRGAMRAKGVLFSAALGPDGWRARG